MSISRSVHHAISTAIFRRVCVFLPYGRLQLRTRQVRHPRNRWRSFQQEIVIHDVPHEWFHPRPLRGATCHLFFERTFFALVYHPPVAQIIVYHPQQVVWNLFLRYRLDAVLPSRGIKRIAYVNANQSTESLKYTSSSSCLSGDVHHCLDGVHCWPVFSKAELVLRETVLANHVIL